MTTTAGETTGKGTGRKTPGGIPFEALMPGNRDWERASNQLLQTWKQQLDTTLRLIDAAVQGTLEMRSSQLAAAMETHARDLDAEKTLSGAKSASDLLAIQLSWMTGNLERSMAYWNQMFQAAADANTKLIECLRGQAEGSDESSGLPAKGA